jgi:CheY-like chemotaxis protein
MPSTPKYSALLVDDDTTSNYLTSIVVNESEIFESPIVFSNPKLALDYIQQNCLLANLQPFPQLMLVDINMPEMDGFEFVQALKHMCPQLMDKSLLCFLSSSTNSKDKLQAKSLGVECFYTKPLYNIHLEELATSLNTRF